MASSDPESSVPVTDELARAAEAEAAAAEARAEAARARAEELRQRIAQAEEAEKAARAEEAENTENAAEAGNEQAGEAAPAEPTTAPTPTPVLNAVAAGLATLLTAALLAATGYMVWQHQKTTRLQHGAAEFTAAARQDAREKFGGIIGAAVAAIGPENIANLGGNKAAMWMPPGGSTAVPGVFGMAALTATGTATARTIGVANLLSRMTRLGFVSAATAGSLAGAREAVAKYTTGAGPGLGPQCGRLAGRCLWLALDFLHGGAAGAGGAVVGAALCAHHRPRRRAGQ